MIVFIISVIVTYFLWKKVIIPFCLSDDTTDEELKEDYVFYYGYDYDPEFDGDL